MIQIKLIAELVALKYFNLNKVSLLHLLRAAQTFLSITYDTTITVYKNVDANLNLSPSSIAFFLIDKYV
jgi:hypothetical protein